MKNHLLLVELREVQLSGLNEFASFEQAPVETQVEYLRIIRHRILANLAKRKRYKCSVYIHAYFGVPLR